jgi:hypothetical protein
MERVADILSAGIGIVAKIMVRRKNAGGKLVAAWIFRAIDGVVAYYIFIKATLQGIATIVDRAEETVLAERVVWLIKTGIGVFVAAIYRAIDLVVASHMQGILTVLGYIAGLGAITPQAVVAQGVVRNMVTRICFLITGVVRADHIIVAVDWNSGEASEREVANLEAVAEEIVEKTEGIVGLVGAWLGVLVARIVRTVHSVAAVGGRSRHAAQIDA